MSALSPKHLDSLVMPAQAASYGYRMIGCGDFNPPKDDDPTLAGEPYARLFGARDGLLTIVATARYLSDPTFRARDVATHDGDEATLAAVHEAGWWPVNHHGCKALGGRQEVARTMGTPNPRVERCARFIVPTLSHKAYLDAAAAKRSLVKLGRVHTPDKVVADYNMRDLRRPHLPQHAMVALNTEHGLHTTDFVVNNRRGTMLRATELDDTGGPVRTPVYGVDAHIVSELYHAIKGLYVLDREAFETTYGLHTGAVVARHIFGPNGEPLKMYQVKA